MEKQTMGTFIAALRRAAGMTQRELAERLNVSDKAVSRWERDECAPDLSLLPLIADLFGVTIDELVRGRRNIEAKREESPPREEQGRADERIRRGVQTIAGKELTKFRNQSLISAGVGAAGIIVALLCNYCYTAARLGFFLSLLFYGAAALLETVFVQNYFTSVGSRMNYMDPTSDGTTIDAYLLPYRERGVRLALAVYAFTMGLVGVTLPLAFAPAYTGLVPDGWQVIGCLLLGVVCAASVLLIYRFAIRPILIRKGILPEPSAPTERDFARRRVMKKYALILAILLAVTGVGAAIFNSIDVSTYAKAKVFEDYDSFVEYMEQPMWEDEDALMIGEAIVSPLPDDAGDLSEEEEWYRDTITDAEGNVLCSYLWRNQAVHMIRPSEGGLPIYVYTGSAINAAYDIQQTVNVCFVLLAIAEAAVCGILCYRKRKKV